MSVRKTPHGTYEARVYAGVDPETGKEIRLHRRAATLKEAKRLEALLKEEVAARQRDAAPQLPIPKTATDALSVEAFLHDWLETSAKPNVKPRTFKRYTGIVRLHLVPELGEIPMEELGARHIARTLAKKRGEGLAPRTVLHIYRCLHTALAVAVQWDLIPSNPCAKVQTPRPARYEPAILDRSNVLQLLKASESDRLYPMVLTAVKTGMRIGELCALRWADVDLDAYLATVARTLHKGGLSPIFGTTKSGKGRPVPLTDDVVEILRDVRTSQAKMREFFKDDYEDYDLVFCQPHGRPNDPHTIARRGWPRIRKAAGLPSGVRFHDLRHTFVSRSLQAGINPTVVSQIVGHHSPGFTLDRYSHVTMEDARESLRQLDSYLFGDNRHKESKPQRKG